MKKKTNKKLRFLPLLLSILSHTLILIIFIHFGFYGISFLKKSSQTNIQTKKTETMVMFEKQPPIKKPIKKPEQPKPKPKPKPKQEAKPQPKLQPIQQAQLKASRPTEKPKPEKKTLPFRFEKEKQPEIKPIKKIAETEKIMPKLVSAEEIKKSALKNLLKKQPKKVPTTKSIPDKAKDSIFSQTKLLIENYDDGNSVINRKGDPNLIPSLEEMKFISYEQKIHNQLVNEWKLLFSYSNNQNIIPPRNPAHFTFVVLEDGSIEDLELIKSSGSSDFDNMVLKSVCSATPFPAIPKHLGIKKYRPKGLVITVPH